MDSKMPAHACPRHFAPLLIISLIVAAAMLGSAAMMAKSFIHASNFSGATFHGVAEREVTSDRIKWSIQLGRLGKDNAEASKLMNEDWEKMKELIASGGITDAEYSFQPIMITQDYSGAPAQKLATQTLVLESAQVSAVSALSQSGAEAMAERGATVNINTTEFFYSGITDLQKVLTKEAINDAANQAVQTLGFAGKTLQSINAPVIVVAPINASTNAAYYNGGYAPQDTASVKKKISVGVDVTFRLR